MPITIVTPQTGDPFGPGFLVTASTNLVGPLPTDAYWQFILTAPPNEDILASNFQLSAAHTTSRVFFSGSPTVTQYTWGQTNWTTGDSAQLVVELRSSSSGLLETASVQVTLDRQTGQVAELADYLRTHGTSSGAGLSEEEHNAVLQTNVGVIAMAGINPLELVGDLVQAIATHNPLGYGSLSVIYTLTGDGELPNEDPVAPKWGVYWVAVTIPAGLGHFHGQSEEYNPRLIQWRTVHEVGGTEMVTSFIDSQTHGELWKFPVQTPRRLEYSILPGVVIQAQWWQFP